jgi:hypothetical protein
MTPLVLSAFFAGQKFAWDSDRLLWQQSAVRVPACSARTCAKIGKALLALVYRSCRIEGVTSAHNHALTRTPLRPNTISG